MEISKLHLITLTFCCNLILIEHFDILKKLKGKFVGNFCLKILTLNRIR